MIDQVGRFGTITLPPSKAHDKGHYHALSIGKAMKLENLSCWMPCAPLYEFV
jgi:hypothetical protein